MYVIFESMRGIANILATITSRASTASKLKDISDYNNIILNEPISAQIKIENETIA